MSAGGGDISTQLQDAIRNAKEEGRFQGEILSRIDDLRTTANEIKANQLTLDAKIEQKANKADHDALSLKVEAKQDKADAGKMSEKLESLQRAVWWGMGALAALQFIIAIAN